MTEEDSENVTLIESNDPAKIIDLNKRRHAKHGKRRPAEGGASREHKYRNVLTKVLRDETERRAGDVTPEEEEFVDLFMNGTSVSHALMATHPDRCFRRNRNGEPYLDADGKPVPLTPDQVWDRGNKLLNTVNIRSLLRQKLEQEMGDVTHTSMVLRNFVLKRYIIEALEGTPASRLGALKELRTYGEVAERDREQTEKVSSPEEVHSAIVKELERLGV